jgi:protein-S-isoprenylcysteine O-methyltransferase Ste14
VRSSGPIALALLAHAAILAAPLLLAGARWTTALAVWILAALALQAAELRGAGDRDEVLPTGDLDVRLAAATGLLVLALQWTAALEHGLRGSASVGPLAPFGVALLAAGVALRWTSLRALGERFVTHPAPRGDLCRDGIYAHLRHPSELGLLACALGAALLLGSPLAATGVVSLLLPLVVWRLRREDRALLATLGGAQADYAATVPGLLPIGRILSGWRLPGARC